MWELWLGHLGRHNYSPENDQQKPLKNEGWDTMKPCLRVQTNIYPRTGRQLEGLSMVAEGACIPQKVLNKFTSGPSWTLFSSHQIPRDAIFVTCDSCFSTELARHFLTEKMGCWSRDGKPSLHLDGFFFPERFFFNATCCWAARFFRV